MAGFPPSEDLSEFAQVMHQIWGFESGQQAVELRRLEDERGAAELGAGFLHLDFLDCIYRRGPQGDALYPDVTLPVHADDADLPARIAQAVAARLEPGDDVICQLGIGRHVDHRIVRLAADMLHRRLDYVADLPYLLNYPEELVPAVTGMRETIDPVSGKAFQHWLAAIGCYASQIDSVFGSRAVMLERMQAHWDEYHGTRFWHPDGPDGLSLSTGAA